MEKSIFSWLLDLEIKNVPNLAVAENAFHVENHKEPELTSTMVSNLINFLMNCITFNVNIKIFLSLDNVP